MRHGCIGLHQLHNLHNLQRLSIPMVRNVSAERDHLSRDHDYATADTLPLGEMSSWVVSRSSRDSSAARSCRHCLNNSAQCAIAASRSSSSINAKRIFMTAKGGRPVNPDNNPVQDVPGLWLARRADLNYEFSVHTARSDADAK